MSRDKLPPELPRLMAGFVENALENDELEMLHKLLAVGPAAQRYYCCYLDLHEELACRFDQAGPVKQGIADVGISRISVLEHLGTWLHDASRTTWAAACLVAIVFYGSFVLLAWNLRPDLAPDMAKRHLTSGLTLSVVATIVAEQNCIWQTDSGKEVPRIGGEMQSNEVLQLRAGIAEVRFTGGAKVMIEGPSELVLQTAGKGYLRRGTLKAHVPSHAKGFEVETPTARVVDLGTDFDLKVNVGETRLAVITGKVDLFPVHVAAKNGRRTMGTPRRVTAGQAVAVTGNAKGTASVVVTNADGERVAANPPGPSKVRPGSTVVAYQTFEGALGNQRDFRGGVGLDFEVRVPIMIHSLGVFDHRGDGIDRSTSPTVQLWSRDTKGTPNDTNDDVGRKILFTQLFTSRDAGELKLGHRFKSLPEPIELPVGSYSIVAYGLSDANPFLAFGKENDGELGLKGHWTFDETLADSAGSNNGTFSGGTVAYVTGKMGKAIEFDGTDDHLEIPYSTDPDSITMAAWVKPSDVTAVNIMARGSSDISHGSNMVFITSNSKFQYFISATSGNHTVTGTTTAQADTWYHVAIVATNNGLMRLYVNGVEEGTAQSIATMWDAGDRFRVGVPHSVFGLGYFDGLVDDLRIYEQALSATQIKAVYEDLSPPSELKASEVRGRIETWQNSIIAVGSRIGEGDPDTFPSIFRDTRVSYGAGSFEYRPQRRPQ